MDTREIMSCSELTKIYTSGLIRTQEVIGAKDVTFNLKRGEIVSLVGESGSGKSTIARIILRLLKPTSGEVLVDGKDITSYNKQEYYRNVQAVFQDPYAAYNPFFRIDRVLKMAFNLLESTPPKDEQDEIVANTLKDVGLNVREISGRFPHQMSGGQLQRLLIARFLIIGSELLIADEPTSMIDASTRAGILNLISDLRDAGKLSVLFITHDIGQAQYISDRILVMKEGLVVEQGATDDVLMSPEHPYTKELLASVPQLYEKWDLS